MDASRCLGGCLLSRTSNMHLPRWSARFVGHLILVCQLITAHTYIHKAYNDCHRFLAAKVCAACNTTIFSQFFARKGHARWCESCCRVFCLIGCKQFLSHIVRSLVRLFVVGQLKQALRMRRCWVEILEAATGVIVLCFLLAPTRIQFTLTKCKFTDFCGWCENMDRCPTALGLSFLRHTTSIDNIKLKINIEYRAVIM